jgi:hypothetical protein
MAYGNPGSDGENFYDGPPSKEKPMEEKDEGQKTYVLPKAVLEGKEFDPGDELVLRIVSMHGDQIEVTYAAEKGEKDESMDEEGGGKEMAQAPMPGGESGGGGGYSSMME